MNPTRTIAAIGTGALMIMGAVDASVLDEQLLERVEMIGDERVEARQVGNVVETKMAWKDAEEVKISYDLGEPTITERMADKRKIEAYFATSTDNQFEYGLLLNERPPTNEFCYTVDIHSYDWFKQPPLTQEEKDEGTFRPEDVVNSFAVYHKTLKNHRVGGENYATGKAFHRYRAEAIDSDENATWAEDSDLKGNQLCDRFDSTWLDNATYPVKI